MSSPRDSTTPSCARGVPPGADLSIRDWAFRGIDAAVAAADRQPAETFRLRSDQLFVDVLANAVMAVAFGDATAFTEAAVDGPASDDHNVDQ